MAYEFVCESEAKRYRSDCSDVLKETCKLLKKKGISAQFSLVGSGARNMITRNGAGPYDLDYNLLIMKAEERYWNDLRLLKETVRNALNRAERREFFSDAQDSTSCLTALLHFKDTPNVEFSFDGFIFNRFFCFFRLCGFFCIVFCFFVLLFALTLLLIALVNKINLLYLYHLILKFFVLILLMSHPSSLFL